MTHEALCPGCHVMVKRTDEDGLCPVCSTKPVQGGYFRNVTQVDALLDDFKQNPPKIISCEDPYQVDVKIYNPFGLEVGYQTNGAAGFDLRASCKSIWIDSGCKLRIPTGLHMAIPHGFAGKIQPRSGLAFDTGVVPIDGTIDSDYRGEISVLLINHSQRAYLISQGDRIAQMVIIPVARAVFVQSSLEDLGATARGDGGWGSTGK